MTGRVAKLGGRANATAADPTSGMCDPCREKFPTLLEMQRACDRPGCEHSWTWTSGEQIEAFATHRAAPQKLCDDCQSRLAALSDREIPCSVPGCQRHGVFGKRAQLLAGAPAVDVETPVMMCGPCANVYEKIKDRPVTCGIQGCKQKWSWSRDEQIKDYAAGLPNEPPRRFCDSCKGVFGAIADREVRCRTSGCKHTWTWPRETQLNSAVVGKPLPKAPHRMCQRCIDLYSGMKDVERPCRRPGCKRTWTDKRGAQLARAVRGKTGDPYPHYCAECEKELGEMEDRQVACKTEHCPGTWSWTAAQQLAAGVRPEVKHEAAGGAEGVDSPKATPPRPSSRSAAISATPPAGTSATPVVAGAAMAMNAATTDVATGAAATDGEVAESADGGESDDDSGTTVASGPGSPGAVGTGPGTGRKRRRRKRRKEIRPPERRCEDCITFLKDRKTKEIPCMGCKTTIFWPPESQLQTHLGNWAEPTLCGACKRDLTEAARVAERESLRHGGATHPMTADMTTETVPATVPGAAAAPIEPTPALDASATRPPDELVPPATVEAPPSGGEATDVSLN